MGRPRYPARRPAPPVDRGGFAVGDRVRRKWSRSAPEGDGKRCGTVKAWESGVWLVHWDDGERQLVSKFHLERADAVDQLGDLTRE